MPGAAPSQGLADLPRAIADKIIPRSRVVARLAAGPRPLVFTNGVFDLLHCGHVEYLARARELGAALIVALNTDASARRLGKGPGRPVNDEKSRAIVVAALASVDWVTWFDEDTPTALLAELRPDWYCKGGDYDMERLQETRLVRSWGGQALALPYRDGHSSTALIRRLRSPAAPQSDQQT